jgi:hypothetical protein
VSAVRTYSLVFGELREECFQIGLIFQTDEGRALCQAIAHLSLTFCCQLLTPLNCQGQSFGCLETDTQGAIRTCGYKQLALRWLNTHLWQHGQVQSGAEGELPHCVGQLRVLFCRNRWELSGDRADASSLGRLQG